MLDTRIRPVDEPPPGLQPVDSPATLRRAFACFPSGVVAVCAMGDDGPVGMAASSFTSVSLDPPLVSVCFQRTSETWPVLQSCERIGVSVLAQGQSDICSRLAMKGSDRFAGIDWLAVSAGSIFIKDAALLLDCSPFSTFVCGDHDIAVLRVHSIRAEPGKAPLIFHGSQYRELVELAEGTS